MKTHLLIFGVCALVGVAVLGHTSQLHGDAPAAPESLSVKKSWTVQGVGPDEKQAVAYVLRMATEFVWDYLRSEDPTFQWKPSPDYVKNNLLRKGDPQRDPNGFKFEHGDGKVEQWERWTAAVQITHRDYVEMCKHNERIVLSAKQGERLGWAARFVALALAGCALIFLYLRLEENTKGYFSRALQFGMLAVFVGIGGVLFFLL